MRYLQVVVSESPHFEIALLKHSVIESSCTAQAHLNFRVTKMRIVI